MLSPKAVMRSECCKIYTIKLELIRTSIVERRDCFSIIILLRTRTKIFNSVRLKIERLALKRLLIVLMRNFIGFKYTGMLPVGKGHHWRPFFNYQ
ncbi:hypothetical protein BET10_12905 [Pseudoalteromonas amylolytica]|uniref:Uncharacterized protein n=1 Tax=Pseudoalteromonas amylolytica TaxID=1859457 RepID=A0A1S1MU30_9GAMM|nr:hypothetical protein BFC16_07075 [Pseudoalteromonas sp. JW3]OHU90293.1 hypothetical protein BET10_12905 [Pseudoalteromonas amylolytica]